MLDATDIERMADAPDASAAFRVLSDTDIADNLTDVKMEEFNKALDADLLQAKKFLSTLDVGDELLRLLYLKYDFHNIKLLFKTKYVGEKLKEQLSPLGIDSTDELGKMILEDNEKANVSPALADVIADLKKKIANNPRPSFIDRETDKKYFLMLGSLAKKLDNQFIIGFVKWQIDIVNLRTLLRIKRMAKDKEYLKINLVDGGRIPRAKLEAQFDTDNEKFIHFLKNYFPPSQEKYIEDYIRHPDLWRLERDLENLELNYIKKVKYITYGPELVLAYHYAKERTTKNIRLIMTGKLNEVNNEEIKQRVREIY